LHISFFVFWGRGIALEVHGILKFLKEKKKKHEKKLTVGKGALRSKWVGSSSASSSKFLSV
jgi:hypothetical protein